MEVIISNPFTKKNPWMSLWLSGANRVAGKSRSVAQAAARRQQAAVATEATKAVTAFWSGFFSPSSPKKRHRTRR